MKLEDLVSKNRQGLTLVDGPKAYLQYDDVVFASACAYAFANNLPLLLDNGNQKLCNDLKLLTENMGYEVQEVWSADGNTFRQWQYAYIVWLKAWNPACNANVFQMWSKLYNAEHELEYPPYTGEQRIFKYDPWTYGKQSDSWDMQYESMPEAPTYADRVKVHPRLESPGYMLHGKLHNKVARVDAKQ